MHELMADIDTRINFVVAFFTSNYSCKTVRSWLGFRNTYTNMFFFLIICRQIHTHSLTTGMKKAQMKTPNNGPPIMPYILRAIWRIKVPKNSAKNAKPIVTPPVTNAVIMLEMNILLAFYSIIF